MAFVTDDTSFQFLDSVTESMAGIDNVKSEELNPEEVLIAIGEVKGLEYLRYASQHHDDKDLVGGSWKKNPVDKHDPAVNSDPAEHSEDDDDGEKSEWFLFLSPEWFLSFLS